MRSMGWPEKLSGVCVCVFGIGKGSGEDLCFISSLVHCGGFAAAVAAAIVCTLFSR